MILPRASTHLNQALLSIADHHRLPFKQVIRHETIVVNCCNDYVQSFIFVDAINYCKVKDILYKRSCVFCQL